MDRFRAWGLSAALATGVGASAADPPGDAKPWYNRVFAGPAKPAAPPQPRPVPTGPLSPETLAEALKAEQDAYLRRLDVCTKLRQVAVDSNDEKLLEKADGLEQQATALYHQRTARLGVRGGPKGSFNPTAVASKPEETLDKTLGSGAASTPLTAAKPAADGKPATAQARQWKVVPE
jgi:hypothetical protein